MHDTCAMSFLAAVAGHENEVALRQVRDDGTFEEWTWAQHAGRVARAAGALRDRGVGPGDRVALLMGNRPLFHVLDTAAMLLRATPFSPYLSSSPQRLAQLMRRAEPALAVVEDAAGAARVHGLCDNVLPLDQEDVLGAAPLDLDALAGAVRPDDGLTIASTSGTTGRPKAARFDHAQVMAMIRSLQQVLPHNMQGWRVISWLPPAQIAERLLSLYLHPVAPLNVTVCPDPHAIHRHLLAVRPHVFVAVPIIWERFRDGAARLPHEAVAAALGLDACEVAVATAAPVDADIVRWFRAKGVPLSEMYGLMEACGPLAWDPVEVRAGWTGRALPGTELSLAPDGEILARSTSVMHRYLGDPERTAAAFDDDGRLRTGDIGEIDGDGYLRIVERAVEMLHLGDGTAVAPVRLEERLRALPGVAAACVVGDGRPYLTALLTLDTGTTAEMQPQIAPEIAALNRQLPAAHRIKRYQLLDDKWEADSDMLTATIKLKRHLITKRYAATIEDMYAA